ncbi:hypothetical protein LCGC14_2898920, partial [marine sediment metagenome]
EAERGRGLTEKLTLSEMDLRDKLGTSELEFGYAGLSSAERTKLAELGFGLASLESSERIAQFTGEINSRIAQLGAAKDELIAQINSDTSLELKDRDAQITRIGGEYSKQVADIQGKYNVKASKESGVGAALVNSDSRMNLQIQEQGYLTDDSGVPLWSKEFSLKELTTINAETGNPWAWDSLNAQILNDQRILMRF